MYNMFVFDLLGLSHPDDILIGVETGADTFDCVAPTREARHGKLYTKYGTFNYSTSVEFHLNSLLKMRRQDHIRQNPFSQIFSQWNDVNPPICRLVKHRTATDDNLTCHNVFYVKKVCRYNVE